MLVFVLIQVRETAWEMDSDGGMLELVVAKLSAPCFVGLAIDGTGRTDQENYGDPLKKKKILEVEPCFTL